MKVLIDTNVLISAVLSADGTSWHAYVKATTYPNCGLISEKNVEELIRIFNKKFPDRLESLNKFLSSALWSLKMVPIPGYELIEETQIRDIQDRPILRAAIGAGADVLLTGDKDFLEAHLEKPLIMSPSEFLQFRNS